MLASLACTTEALIHLVLQSRLSLVIEDAHYQGVLAFVFFSRGGGVQVGSRGTMVAGGSSVLLRGRHWKPLRGLPPHRRLPAVLLGASCGRTARCGPHWFFVFRLCASFARAGRALSLVRLPVVLVYNESVCAINRDLVLASLAWLARWTNLFA
jgi:hypothetical protein